MSRAKRASHSATNTTQKREKTVAEVFYLKPRSPNVSPESLRQRMCANLDRFVANLEDKDVELLVRLAELFQPHTAAVISRPSKPATVITFRFTPPCREPKPSLP